MDRALIRYVVTGSYDGGNGGMPVTGDYVVASSEDEATEIVRRVRERTDSWNHDSTETFEEHIASEKAKLTAMETMTIEAVEASWEDTCANLGVGEDVDEED